MTKPIILLIGGATGTGKSTVATEVAHRLGINRVTSHRRRAADAARVLRAGVHAVDPPLELRRSRRASRSSTAFLDQTTNVLVAVEAADRARAPGGLVDGASRASTSSRGCSPCRPRDATVVQCVLAIEDEDEHATHFWIRDAASRRRAAGGRSTSSGSTTSAGCRTTSSSARATTVCPVIENANVERDRRAP